MFSPDLVSDQQLVSRYLGGSEDALSALIERHKDRIFAYIMKYVKNKDLANDMFQDIFIKAIQTLRKGGYNEEGKFLPWMMRISHNLIIDHFRKNKRMPTFSGSDDFDIFDVISSDEKSVEDTMVEDNINCDLKALVDELPKEQRDIIILRHFCDMSFKDIAEEKNISINTALGRMRYALINLRKMMEERNIKLTL
jgi:RNA polymerase sigma factor (sigma-70 family)